MYGLQDEIDDLRKTVNRLKKALIYIYRQENNLDYLVVEPYLRPNEKQEIFDSEEKE